MKRRMLLLLALAHPRARPSHAPHPQRVLQGEGGVLVLDVGEGVTTRGRRRVPGGAIPSAPRWAATEASDGVLCGTALLSFSIVGLLAPISVIVR